MCSHKLSLLTVIILTLMMIVPGFLFAPNFFSYSSPSSSGRVLAGGSQPPYFEHLAVYLTSGETFWRLDLGGGNISVSSVSIPSGVTGYSITATHYNLWSSQFEIFSKYGYGLLGPFEPSPNGTILTVNTSSSSDAKSLADSLNIRFGLAYQPLSSTSSNFTFLSPMDFNTEMHVNFWKLVPRYYGGFAGMLSENQFESSDLSYYKLSYSGNAYAISIGGLKPLTSSNFTLYNQLGLTQPAVNYSSFSQRSSMEIHVLGGFATNTTAPFVNHYSNFSASYYSNAGPSPADSRVPDINATLKLSFPTVLAYRTVNDLTPTKGENVTASIFVKDISPPGTPQATNVSVNDSWIYADSSAFALTGVGKTSGSQNLTSGQSFTAVYAFTVLVATGTYELPATPVTYQITTGNQTIRSSAFLNPETINVAATGTPELEAVATVRGGSITAGQPLSFSVNVTNRGDGTAFNLLAPNQPVFASLAPRSTWSFNESAGSASLTITNSSISYAISWKDPGDVSHFSATNNVSAIYNFATPGSPAVSLGMSLNLASGRASANITLWLSNSSPNSLSNLTISQSLPSGVSFFKSYNGTSVRSSSGTLVGNLTSLGGGKNVLLTYAVNFTSPDQNYIFFPANVTAPWGKTSVVHFSQGIGLPLGVGGNKTITPDQGFQGSNVTVNVGIVNKGPLPIFNVNLNNTQDPFLSIVNSTPSSESVLLAGGRLNATLNANLTGAPGTYNSSAAGFTFMFAGANKTASTNTFRAIIYHLIEANLTALGPKIEENHNIAVDIVLTNPSNVTVSNVQYATSLPSDLKLVEGSLSFNIPSLGPRETVTKTVSVSTGQPYVYSVNGGNLTFGYQGHMLKGLTAGVSINVVDDIKLRYGVPVLIALVIVLLTVFYVRRLSGTRKR